MVFDGRLMTTDFAAVAIDVTMTGINVPAVTKML